MKNESHIKFEWTSSVSSTCITLSKQSGIIWINASEIKVPAANAISILIIA